MALDTLPIPHVADQDQAAHEELPARPAIGRRGLGRVLIGVTAALVVAGGAGSLAMHAGMNHTMNGTPMDTAAKAPMASMDDPTGTAAPATAVTLPAPGPDAGPLRVGGPGRAVSIAPASATSTTTAGAASIRAGSTSGSSTASAARYATIRDGDTFASVAARNGVSEARVAALNPGVDPSALVVGQGLRVG